MEKMTIGFRGYKQFAKYQTIEDINQINLIVGRNNVGKTKICDVIEEIFKNSSDFSKISFETYFDFESREQILSEIFNGTFSPHKYQEEYFRSQLSNRKININLKQGYEKGDASLNSISLDYGNNVNYFVELFSSVESGFRSTIRQRLVPFANNVFRISLNKRITKIDSLIVDTAGDPPGFDDGKITNLAFWYFGTPDNDPKKRIQKKILNSLNDVMGSNDAFSDIDVKTIKGEKKSEIFLSDADGSTHKLSDCGEGLQTVISVLFALYGTGEKDHSVFIFEDLENDLHPYAEKRLYNHIIDYSLKHPDCFFPNRTFALIHKRFFSTHKYRVDIWRRKGTGVGFAHDNPSFEKARAV